MAKPRKRPKPQQLPAGYVILEDVVKGSSDREKRNVLARPGDFVWKYRKGHYSEAEYLAGCEFARRWEAVGAGEPKSVEWGKQPAGSWQGLPDATCLAHDKLKSLSCTLGQMVTWRMIAFTTLGWTVKELSYRWQTTEAEMRDLLKEDLGLIVKAVGYTPPPAREKKVGNEWVRV